MHLERADEHALSADGGGVKAQERQEVGRVGVRRQFLVASIGPSVWIGPRYIDDMAQPVAHDALRHGCAEEQSTAPEHELDGIVFEVDRKVRHDRNASSAAKNVAQFGETCCGYTERNLVGFDRLGRSSFARQDLSAPGKVGEVDRNMDRLDGDEVGSTPARFASNLGKTIRIEHATIVPSTESRRQT